MVSPFVKGNPTIMELLSYTVVISTLLLLTLLRIECFTTKTNSKSSLQHRNNFLLALASTSAVDDEKSRPTPPVPVPFRDENAFVLAGEIPTDEALEDDVSPPPIRQSKFSQNPLLSPARRVANPYGWMRDDSRTNSTVLNHLREENEYTRLMTQHLDGLKEEIYAEFLSAIEETDYTTPGACDGYWYYSRFIEGLSYPIYCRAPRKEGDLYHPPINDRWNEKGENPLDMQPLLPGEEVYLNLPAIASKKKYLACGAIKVSPDDQYVAYSIDETGGETCQLYIKHIESGKEWVLYDGDQLLEGDGNIVWDDEGKAIFFCTLDATHRPYRLYRRQIFDNEGNYIDDNKQHDELMFEEEDGSFSLRISKTFDSRYLVLTCSAKESTELHYLDLERSKGIEESVADQFVCISKRLDKLCYRVTHCSGYWLVQTNNMGITPNLSLKACRIGEEKDSSSWLDVVDTENEVMFDGADGRSLDGVTVFSPPDENDHAPLAYAVVCGREEGIPRIWILELAEDEEIYYDASMPLKASPLHVTKSCRLEFDESAYDCGIGVNKDNTLPYVVVSYESLVTPPSHIAIPLSNPEDFEARRVLKEKQVEGYDKELFGCERFTVKSRDGETEIPVSMVFQRDAFTKNNGNIPVHLFGYGSYGASIEASFRSTRIPLLRRGVVYILAHVRGGGEKGRPWYEEQGKYLGKKNTFNDFVDIARWLTDKSTQQGAADEIGRGITNPSKLSCEGRSAGGLLIGASINQAPDLFRVAILGVPFVDLMCTMIDSSIPLTCQEWQEWGNPNEEKYHEYMMSYCPMQNVQKGKTYPSCLITGGLFDPRVMYWEPAKYCATLRHTVSGSLGPILLKTDLDAGHFAQSDRYKYLKEQAYEYAFLLEQLGLVS